jgi:hypothetical protein
MHSAGERDRTSCLGSRSAVRPGDAENANTQVQTGEDLMSLGTILLIILIIALLGGFSGVVGGYGYGFGHGGVGLLGTLLIIVVVLMLLGRI